MDMTEINRLQIQITRLHRIIQNYKIALEEYKAPLGHIITEEGLQRVGQYSVTIYDVPSDGDISRIQCYITDKDLENRVPTDNHIYVDGIKYTEDDIRRFIKSI